VFTKNFSDNFPITAPRLYIERFCVMHNKARKEKRSDAIRRNKQN